MVDNTKVCCFEIREGERPRQVPSPGVQEEEQIFFFLKVFEIDVWP